VFFSEHSVCCTRPPTAAFLLHDTYQTVLLNRGNASIICLSMPLFYRPVGFWRVANTISVSCYRLCGRQHRTERAAFNVMPFRGDSGWEDFRRNGVIDWMQASARLARLVPRSLIIDIASRRQRHRSSVSAAASVTQTFLLRYVYINRRELTLFNFGSALLDLTIIKCVRRNCDHAVLLVR